MITSKDVMLKMIELSTDDGKLSDYKLNINSGGILALKALHDVLNVDPFEFPVISGDEDEWDE